MCSCQALVLFLIKSLVLCEATKKKFKITFVISQIKKKKKESLFSLFLFLFRFNTRHLLRLFDDILFVQGWRRLFHLQFMTSSQQQQQQNAHVNVSFCLSVCLTHSLSWLFRFLEIRQRTFSVFRWDLLYFFTLVHEFCGMFFKFIGTFFYVIKEVRFGSSILIFSKKVRVRAKVKVRVMIKVMITVRVK